MTIIEELKNLKLLLDQGWISEEEFSVLKKNLIEGSMPAANPYGNVDLLKGKHSKNEGQQNYGSNEPSGKPTKKEVFKMLEQMNTIVDSCSLCDSIQDNNYSKVELLLNAGVSPNEPMYDEVQKRNYFPVHQAAFCPNTEILRLLLDYKANVNLKDDMGYTPIFYAIESGSLANFQLLIKSGTNINHVSNNLLYPLKFAKRNNRVEMIETLKKTGAIEMRVKDMVSPDRLRLVYGRRIKLTIIAAFLLICFFLYLFTPNSDSNSPKNIDETAMLVCKWCKKQIIEKDGQGVICYSHKDEYRGGGFHGCAWVQFYSGTKYEYCSDKCCLNGIIAGME